MAQRPVFLPHLDGSTLVKTMSIDFQWHAGLSASQKQRSIASLHDAARQSLAKQDILEISSKSLTSIGVALSAFNLMVKVGKYPKMSVECAFQGSKVFQNGGPYTELFRVHPRDAKRDERLRSSQLTAFHIDGVDWPIEPPTAFYDWLYILALSQNRELADKLMGFEAFTDIEFNPERSINCQAYSAALYVSLCRRGLYDAQDPSRDAFLAAVQKRPLSNARQRNDDQGSLF